MTLPYPAEDENLPDDVVVYRPYRLDHEGAGIDLDLRPKAVSPASLPKDAEEPVSASQDSVSTSQPASPEQTPSPVIPEVVEPVHPSTVEQEVTPVVVPPSTLEKLEF